MGGGASLVGSPPVLKKPPPQHAQDSSWEPPALSVPTVSASPVGREQKACVWTATLPVAVLVARLVVSDSLGPHGP